MISKHKFSVIFLFLAGFLPLLLEGAGKKIVCTTFPLYIFTKNVVDGVKGTQLSLLIAPGRGCPHDYALTPRDMRSLAKQDLLIRNGATLDDFVLKVMKKVNPSAPILDSSHGGAFLPVTRGVSCEGGSHKHDHKDHHHKCDFQGNPHLFASPFTAGKIVENITGFLCKNDPANAPLYRKNGLLYQQKLRELARETRETLAPFAGVKIVAQHNVFDYLAHYTGLRTAGYLSFFGSDAPGAGRLGELARTIRQEKVRLILTEPQYPDGSARRLAKECRIPLAVFDPVATGPANAPKEYYEKVMRENLKRLKGALQK